MGQMCEPGAATLMLFLELESRTKAPSGRYCALPLALLLMTACAGAQLSPGHPASAPSDNTWPAVRQVQVSEHDGKHMQSTWIVEALTLREGHRTVDHVHLKMHHK